jgi:hypothetical protein
MRSKEIEMEFAAGTPPPFLKDFYLARQPILNRDEQLVAHESNVNLDTNNCMPCPTALFNAAALVASGTRCNLSASCRFSSGEVKVPD